MIRKTIINPKILKNNLKYLINGLKRILGTQDTFRKG